MGGTASDLTADYEVLNRVRHNLDHIAELMKKPGQEMKEVTGSSMGFLSLPGAWTTSATSGRTE